MCRLAPDEDELLRTALLLARRRQVRAAGAIKNSGGGAKGGGAWRHRASLCYSSVKPGGTSLLGVTQRAALVVEIVPCITQRGRAVGGLGGWGGKIDEVSLAAQYIQRGLKDVVMGMVLWRSITLAISYRADKWGCGINLVIKELLSAM